MKRKIIKRLFNIIILTHVTSVLFSQGTTLEYYISEALSNNSTLKTYASQLELNRIDSAIVRAGYQPQLTGISNNYYAPVIGGWGYDEIITNIAQVSGMVQASKTFLSKANKASQFAQIALQNQALKDSLLLSEKDLIKVITDQYITAYGSQLTVQYSGGLYNLLREEEDILKRLARTSAIKQTEFLSFNITLQQQELNYLQAQIQFNNDYLTLNYLSGINDTTINQLEEPNIRDSLSPDVYNTVFYRQYKTDSLRIVNERKIIDFSYRPAIAAATDAGFNSSLQNMPYRNFGVSAGISIKVPIYDGHQRKLKHQKLEIEERARLARRDFFLKQYNQQVAQLYIQLRGVEKLFDKMKQQVNYSKTLVMAYEKLLETSDVKVIDFITAITNYINAQNSYRQNFISRLRIMNQINYWNR